MNHFRPQQQKNTLCILSFLGVLFILAENIFALGSFGVAPDKFNLGSVEKGDSVDFIFYLYTPNAPKTKLELIPSNKHIAFFKKDFDEDGVVFEYQKASMEDITNWIEFEENPILIDPENKMIIELSGGEKVIVNKKVRGTLNIPLDAEPGYHTVQISFDPQDISPNKPFATTIIGMPTIFFVFKIEPVEQAVSDIKINYIDVKRKQKDIVKLLVNIKNTGTVTTKLDNENTYFEITKNSNSNDIIHHKVFGYDKNIAPQESITLETVWIGIDEIKDGNYKVNINLEWLTGSSEFKDTIFVPSYINIKPQAKPPIIKPKDKIINTETTSCNYPVWIPLLGLLVGIVIYLRKKKVSIILPIIIIISTILLGYLLWGYTCNMTLSEKIISFAITTITIYWLW